MPTMRHVVESYCLSRELKKSTEIYYRRVLSVFSRWLGRVPESEEFTPDLVSRFLAAKQHDNRSAYYRKSLRNGLRALLAHAGRDIPRGKLRSVKLTPLEPAAWSESEVAKLVAASDVIHESDAERRQYMRTLILAAYYTGMSQIDLHRLSRSSIAPNGVVRYVRSKTGKPVVTAMPVELIPQLPAGDPIWPLRVSPELFRRRFAVIVRLAGLSGSFKTLRKSSGTGVELLFPGRGHEHLGNSRKVFETHYLARDAASVTPMLPRIVPSA